MIKAENIASKEFRKSLYGYDCEQVDLFLDELIVQLKQMEQERLEMSTMIEYLVGIVQKENPQMHENDFVSPVSPHDLLSNTNRNVLESQELFSNLVDQEESAVLSDEAEADQ
jgi:DivIVA domain-containing protein